MPAWQDRRPRRRQRALLIWCVVFSWLTAPHLCSEEQSLFVASRNADSVDRVTVLLLKIRAAKALVRDNPYPQTRTSRLAANRLLM
jgi:hypothetical protein